MVRCCLEIFRQRLELGERAASHASVAAEGICEAVVDVVVDQDLLGVPYRALHGVELLREVEAGAAFLDHRHDARQVTLRPIEPFDDVRMRVMFMAGRRVGLFVDVVGHIGQFHVDMLSPRVGYGKGSRRVFELYSSRGSSEGVMGIRRFIAVLAVLVLAALSPAASASWDEAVAPFQAGETTLVRPIRDLDHDDFGFGELAHHVQPQAQTTFVEYAASCPFLRLLAVPHARPSDEVYVDGRAPGLPDEPPRG